MTTNGGRRLPLNIAHRGARGSAPENTLAAFEIALRQGAEAVELDIHLSKDGELMVCHDATLNRTTDGRGQIRDLTLEEIKRFDAGSWYSAAFIGQRVPTLGEVLDLVPEPIQVNVEMKASGGIAADSGPGSAPAPAQPPIESALLALLKKRGRLAQVFVSSFDHGCLVRLKRMEPAVRIGLLYSDRSLQPLSYAASLGVEVYSLHPDYRLLKHADVQALVAAGYRVYPYTVNDRKDMQRLMEQGVSGIITDYPDRLLALLQERHAD